MKKIILIAALFAATVSAKAQQMVTINNNTSEVMEFRGTATPMPSCTGVPAISTTFIPIAGGTTTTLAINDAGWLWSPTTPPLPRVDLEDIAVANPCGGGVAPGVLIGQSCHGLPFTGAFLDCMSNRINVTWTYGPGSDITIDIN